MTAAHVELVTTRTLLVAHVVMAALLLAFAALSWSEMTDGALLAWRRVIAAGFLVTLAGTVGLATSAPAVPLLWVAVVRWMVLPAAGLLYTGRLVTTFARAYLVGGACSALGAVAYLLAPLVVGTPLTLAGLTRSASDRPRASSPPSSRTESGAESGRRHPYRRADAHGRSSHSRASAQFDPGDGVIS